MSIGERITEKRKELKLNRNQLANKLGISPTALQKIENGKTKSTKHLVTIAEILGSNPAWLQFGDKHTDNENISLSKKEKELLSNFRMLNNEEKVVIQKIVKNLASETFKEK